MSAEEPEATAPRPEPSAEQAEIARLLRELIDVEKERASTDAAPPRKDLWDKFATVSTFASSVIIASIGLYFTHQYDVAQTTSTNAADAAQEKIQQLTTLEKFVPHLISTNPQEQRVSISMITVLGDAQLAADLVKLYPTAGAIAGLAGVQAKGSGSDSRIASAALQSVGSRGIDVSHYQGSIDWKAVRAQGIVFAYIGASDGVSYTDRSFRKNYDDAGNAGILRGAYHLYEPADDPLLQASHFATVIAGRPGDLPPAVDLEVTPRSETSQYVENVQRFITTLVAATSSTVVIYSNASFANQYLANSTLTNYPLWIADYDVASPPNIAGWKSWQFWQSGNALGIKGISGNVDADIFNGTINGLRTLRNGAPSPG